MLEGDRLVIEFPRSALIYLRSTKETLDEMTIEIRTSDGQSISNRIPVMKLNLYGLDELFEKKLWRSIRIQEGRFLMLWVEKSLSVKLTGF